MAYARRGFVWAEVGVKVYAGHSTAALRRLYAIEREAKDLVLDADALRAVRQSESLPMLQGLKA